MNGNKVTLPRDVAEAIDLALKFEESKSSIIAAVYDGGYAPLSEHFGDDLDTLLEALVNGYEVEMSPEDEFKSHLRAHVENVKFYAGKWKRMDSAEKEQERFSSGFVAGAKAAVKAYGINNVEERD